MAIGKTNSQGIYPSGNINITDTNSTNVKNYATAQVLEPNLIAENIKKDVNILGILGTFEGGGASQWQEVIVGSGNNEAYVIFDSRNNIMYASASLTVNGITITENEEDIKYYHLRGIPQGASITYSIGGDIHDVAWAFSKYQNYDRRVNVSASSSGSGTLTFTNDNYWNYIAMIYINWYEG